VLQLCCSCIAVCCSMWHSRDEDQLECTGSYANAQCVAVCCSVLQCVAVCCSCVAAVLQCTAACDTHGTRIN